MYSLCFFYCTLKAEACLWARFSHAVWSCLERWREEQPHPSSTEPESVFSGISVECWFAFPREWLNTEEMSASDQRNSLCSITPEGANGRPDIPRKVWSTGEMSQQIWVRMLSLCQRHRGFGENVLMSEDERSVRERGRPEERWKQREGGGMIYSLHPRPPF